SKVQRYAARLLAAFAMLMAVVAGIQSAQAADGDKKHRVIIHVTENVPWKWNQALNNAYNLKKNLGKDTIDIEIVVNGPGLNMMKMESTVGPRLETAIKDGVGLLACGATMKAAKVEKEDLYPGVGVVPGGVKRIIDRQEQGWVYIKI
ncbi:MAG: DsrE family protein, partial [Burkholderiales bacterium]